MPTRTRPGTQQQQQISGSDDSPIVIVDSDSEPELEENPRSSKRQKIDNNQTAGE
jgi:hypothetical protein